MAKPPTSPLKRGGWRGISHGRGMGSAKDEEARALLDRVKALFAEEPPVGEEEELARIEDAVATWGRRVRAR